jgi:hypothetical protein
MAEFVVQSRVESKLEIIGINDNGKRFPNENPSECITEVAVLKLSELTVSELPKEPSDSSQ